MGWNPPPLEEFNHKWLTPAEAMNLLGFPSESTCQTWILDRLKSNVLLAVARTGTPDGKLVEFPHVPSRLWESWDDYGHDHFWETGDASFRIGGVTGYGDSTTVRYQDVRLDPETFDGRPPKQPPPTETPPVFAAPAQEAVVQRGTNKGGAPRKGWWDDLWLSVVRKIEAKDWAGGTFKSAARLEIALIEMAEEMGFSPGDSTLKPMSLKLFKYLEESGGK